MFELLLSVSGIGAKSALVILSNVSVSSFALAIINNDINLLKKLPGIGPKTAQRVILELKDKLKKENEIVANENTDISDTINTAIMDDEKIAEATAALKVLGYTGKEIEKARQIARGGIVGVNIMVATQRYEDYVRAAVLAGTDCIISGAGLPLDLPGIVAETEDRMAGRSHRTMLAPIVSSPRALSVCLLYTSDAADEL